MPSLDKWEDDFDRRPGMTTFKILLIGFAMIVALVALTGLVSTGNVFFQAEKAKITNKPRETIRVFNPDRSLATYEGFYDTCNQFNANIIKAKDAAEEAESREKAYNAEADTFGQDRKSINAVREDARALRNVARNLAAKYNADSAANSRAPFKASDLPYTLDATGSELAQCGNPKEAGR